MNRIYLIAFSALTACTPTKEVSQFETFSLSAGMVGDPLCAPDGQCPEIVDHCQYLDANAVFIARVNEVNHRLTCENSTIPREHYKLSISRLQHIGGTWNGSEIVVFHNHTVQPPKVGDNLLVNSRNFRNVAFGSYMFINSIEGDIEFHEDSWIDLPTSIHELELLVSQVLDSPESLCNEEKKRYMSPAERETWSFGEPNPSHPCGEPIVVDDDDVNADPGPSPEDDI